MNDNDPNSPSGGSDPGSGIDRLEVLMTRIVDGESDCDDPSGFGREAAEGPGLWQRLARRQDDQLRLIEQVDAAIESAAETELPDLVPAVRTARVAWTTALVGSAAMLLLAAAWVATSAGLPAGGPEVREAVTPVPPPRLAADDHFRQYLQAPNVLGEIEPVVLEVQEMSDGRVVVRYLRRVEEVAFIDPEQPVPVSEKGELTVSPSELRGGTSPPSSD